MKKIISIDGMSCGHCTARVQKSLESLEGVTEVSVSLDPGQAVIAYTGELSDHEIKNTVYDAGYDATSIQAES